MRRAAPSGMGARRRARGIALLVVMVVVLLSSLLALWAFRSSLVNEALVGNDASYQRAFEAAQAMIQDAEQDIRGTHADGTNCVPSASDVRICRRGATLRFIDEDKDLGTLLGRLDTAPTRCLQGICQKRTGEQDFWNDAAAMTEMTADGVGARYGEYTGALSAGGSAALANPLLASRNASDGGAWYWIEVMPYDRSEAGLLTDRSKMDLNLNPNVVYRITAIARGPNQRTQVVLQSTFAHQKLKN
ncbi:PilX N-terminal domain-containing pilus assembly protein [Pseudorhodoferax sp.]|uniref:pilus assembly PilX family protein n=1 Tax=Pseudorhodoferax sp. TaxID=1993553 RepID=UPI0039E3A544